MGSFQPSVWHQYTGNWTNFKAWYKQLESLGKKGSKEPEFTMHNCPATMNVQIFENGVHGVPFYKPPYHLWDEGPILANKDICDDYRPAL